MINKKEAVGTYSSSLVDPYGDALEWRKTNIDGIDDIRDILQESAGEKIKKFSEAYNISDVVITDSPVWNNQIIPLYGEYFIMQRPADIRNSLINCPDHPYMICAAECMADKLDGLLSASINSMRGYQTKNLSEKHIKKIADDMRGHRQGDIYCFSSQTSSWLRDNEAMLNKYEIKVRYCPGIAYYHGNPGDWREFDDSGDTIEQTIFISKGAAKLIILGDMPHVAIQQADENNDNLNIGDNKIIIRHMYRVLFDVAGHNNSGIVHVFHCEE